LFNYAVQPGFITAFSAVHVKLLRTHWKYRNQAEMKVWTAHQHYPVERLTAVTDMLPVYKFTQDSHPDSENKQHALKIVQFMHPGLLTTIIVCPD